MRYERLPRQDRVALEWYIGCLKEASNINIDYEIYEGSSWYIIYLDDNIFDELEDKIDEILDHNHKLLIIDKEILFAPKRFMVSYEEKIEGWLDIVYYENIEAETNSYNSNHFHLSYKTQEIKSSGMSDDSVELYKIEQKQGGANEHNKAA